ncbi:MAG: hypothetical protein GXO73_11600, partial [Calditrichaeota bacterium]|nr:hypothetical protein [Calditrichota bacterium]
MHERGENTLNWFSMDRDPMAKFYAEERRKAALRPWRRRHLEELAIELQLTPARDEVFDILDRYRADLPNSPNDDESGEVWRYRLHRMDVRGWKVEEDRENKRVIIKPGKLDEDLAEKQEAAMQDNALRERFTKLLLWAEKTYAGEPFDAEYYSDFHDALTEAKELREFVAGGQSDVLIQMQAGGIVTAAAVCIRDHLEELDEKAISWAIEQILGAIQASLKKTNSLAHHDRTNMNGTQAAAEALPGLVALANEDKEGLEGLRSVIALTITHPNDAVRRSAARGIRDKMWQHDPVGAEACLCGAIEYSRLRMYYSHWGTVLRARVEGASDLKPGNDKSREERLAEEVQRLIQQISEANMPLSEGHISLTTHSAWHLLEPCLMIPVGSSTASHRNLLVRVLGLILD